MVRIRNRITIRVRIRAWFSDVMANGIVTTVLGFRAF